MNDGMDVDFDVTICGGGLAGLTLARQLQRSWPELRIAVVEKTRRPLARGCHKVGESSVELGSQYLEQLGLADYLREHHLIKFGLRFFPGGGQLPLARRAELGPSQEPLIASYQIDRGRFEEDLRAMNEASGIVLREGVSVTDVVLGSGDSPHEVVLGRADGHTRWKTTWVVDATGRHALLKRRLKLRRASGHTGNACWWRVSGRVEPADLVPAEETRWHGRSFAGDRWRSTTHLMGEGYWVWLIPLSSGMTSIGIVVHDEAHGFDEVRNPACADAFLATHEPHLAARLQGVERLDFHCLKNYSHTVARSWSHDRWAVVGEAGAFVDPLYSPGTDFIAFANCFTEELIRVDREGGDLPMRVRELNLQYRSLCSGGTDVFRSSAPVYGHARAMATKIYWDNFSYWSFPCQYFLQRLYRVSGPVHRSITEAGARFVELSNYVQVLMRAWAKIAPEPPREGFVGMPSFPSLLVETHLDLQKRMTPQESLAYFQMRLEHGEEMVGEFVVRTLVELGPDRGAELLGAAEVGGWRLKIDARRFEAEGLRGIERRHALSPIVRDVERNLGRTRPHSQWREALGLLADRS